MSVFTGPVQPPPGAITGSSWTDFPAVSFLPPLYERGFLDIYSFPQWVLLFYCFCGWVWESCFVSCRQRQWVNRGFLEGPILPIYGTGAMDALRDPDRRQS